MTVLSTRIVLDCFYLLIFYSEKFSTDVCRLPYAVNVNLNLSFDLFPPLRLWAKTRGKMTRAGTFSRQNDLGLRVHYRVLRKSGARSRTRPII